jgi:O-methyltransferase involved in polyketide biosynthesis
MVTVLNILLLEDGTVDFQGNITEQNIDQTIAGFSEILFSLTRAKQRSLAQAKQQEKVMTENEYLQGEKPVDQIEAENGAEQYLHQADTEEVQSTGKGRKDKARQDA